MKHVAEDWCLCVKMLGRKIYSFAYQSLLIREFRGARVQEL